MFPWPHLSEPKRPCTVENRLAWPCAVTSPRFDGKAAVWRPPSPAVIDVIQQKHILNGRKISTTPLLPSLLTLHFKVTDILFSVTSSQRRIFWHILDQIRNAGCVNVITLCSICSEQPPSLSPSVPPQGNVEYLLKWQGWPPK